MPSRRARGDNRPVATFALMAACGLAYVLEVLVTRLLWEDATPISGVFGESSGVAPETLVDIGANLPAAPALWRLVASCFLHAGPVHLIFNLMALRFLGPYIEIAYGRAAAVAAFVATGIAASLASVWGHRLIGGAALSVGASGALCGYMGVILVYARRAGGPFGEVMQGNVLRWMAATLAYGLLLPVDNWAHGGGFLAGVALGTLFPHPRRTERRAFNLAALAAATLSLLLVGASAIRAFQEVGARREANAIGDVSIRMERVVRTVEALELAARVRRPAPVGSGAGGDGAAPTDDPFREASQNLYHAALALSVAPRIAPDEAFLVRRLAAQALLVRIEILSGGPRTVTRGTLEPNRRDLDAWLHSAAAPHLAAGRLVEGSGPPSDQ